MLPGNKGLQLLLAAILMCLSLAETNTPVVLWHGMGSRHIFE